jgi:hypothetical protein
MENQQHMQASTTFVEESLPASRQNFRALVGEKATFILGLSLAGPYTVLTALAAQLTTSTVIIGSVTTVWNGALFAPVMFIARWIRRHPERMPIIRRASLLRGIVFPLVALWLMLSGAQPPALALAVLLVGMLVFCVADGFVAVPYVDVIARVLTSQQRARMAWQGLFLGGVISIGASLLVQHVLTPGVLPFPANFSLLLAGAGVFFLGASLSLSFISERDVQAMRPHQVLADAASGPRRARDIFRQDAAFRRMLLTRLLTGADQMAFPFYTVFALNVLKLSPEAVGVFVGAQTIGSLLGPAVFGRVAERAGPHRVIMLSAMTQFAAPVLGLLYALTLGTGVASGGTSSFSLGIAAAFIVAGLAMSSMSLGYFNYPLDWCPDQDRPTYVGLLSMAGAVLMLAPALGGVIVQYVSYAALFALTALLVGAGVLVSLTLPDKRA